MKKLPTFKEYILSLVNEYDENGKKKKKTKKSDKEIKGFDLPTGILKYLQIAAQGEQ